MKIWMNGKVLEKDQAAVSVLDHGLLYGDGVFEGIRVYNGRIFQCAAHLDRLFASAEAVRLKMPMTREQLEAAMYQTIRANRAPDAYVRLVVTRGPGNLGLNPFICHDPTVFIIVDQIALYPKEMYERGMAVIIARTIRTSPTMLPPRVKSLNYLNNIMAKIEAIDAGAGEALMLNAEGHVAEATGDNVFIVEDSAAVTPPVEAGILIGVTRRVVFGLCADLGIPVREEAITSQRLYAARECFLTGTAAEVVPVTTVDRKPIGSGRPGPVTLKLVQAFRDLVASGKG